MDTSIRFRSDKILKLFPMVKRVGMLTRYLNLNLTCYTDRRMFEWFQQTPLEFSHLHTIEANIILLHNNLLTKLVMKSWVTCALDASCIAPDGASIYGSVSEWNWLGPDCSKCGCHRFDQDALTVVASFFYAHPVGFKRFPAYALNGLEADFEIKRRDVAQYISDQISNYFN